MWSRMNHRSFPGWTKPLSLLSSLIRSAKDPLQLILDLFLGQPRPLEMGKDCIQLLFCLKVCAPKRLSFPFAMKASHAVTAAEMGVAHAHRIGRPLQDHLADLPVLYDAALARLTDIADRKSVV